MKVYLFEDYLKVGIGGTLDDSKLIAEIEPIDELPGGFVELEGRRARVCCLNINTGSACYIEWVERKILNEDELSFESEAKCPHCGECKTDSWEFSDEDKSLCGTCGTEFSITRDVDVTYSTKVISRNTKTLKLNLVQSR
jgi:DNA-directed RNA polymerase subunit RPC12/RpoP